jgi:hypothetical protein
MALSRSRAARKFCDRDDLPFLNSHRNLLSEGPPGAFSLMSMSSGTCLSNACPCRKLNLTNG